MVEAFERITAFFSVEMKAIRLLNVLKNALYGLETRI